MLPFFKRLHKEEEIISGLRSSPHEKQRWERKLYENYFYLVNHGSRKYRFTLEEAASVYSDTIISVIDNIASHRFEGRSSLKSFVYQIFKNKSVDLIRKKTTNKSTIYNNNIDIESIAMILPDKTQNLLEKLMRKSDQDFLLEKLKELGEKCRNILLMFEDGYADKEIALELSYSSAETAKTSRMRCIEKLREKVIESRYE